MFSGERLGKALEEAMLLKKVKQHHVAAEFEVTQPSVSEWIKFGRIHKKHIPHLVSWFADVVGPEHWGLPSTWSGLRKSTLTMAQLDGTEGQLILMYRLLKIEARQALLDRARELVEGSKPWDGIERRSPQRPDRRDH